MTGRDRIEALFQRRLEALLKDLPSAQGGNVEALHRTRVASRRVREALPLLGGAVEREKLNKSRRQARRLTRALGAVRELDVALKLLDSVAATRPAQRLALERVREHLTRERDALRREMLTRLHELKPDRVAQKIATRVESRPPHARHAWRHALNDRLRRRAGHVRNAVREAGAIYEPDRLHAVRIAVKKLRYALELAGETRSGGSVRVLRNLKATQELLGEMHDRQVLIQHVRAVQSRPGAAVSESRELDRLARAFEAECRSLHAQFTARRDLLVKACEYLRDRPVPKKMPDRRPSGEAAERRTSGGASERRTAKKGAERRSGAPARRVDSAADRRR
jgi:CHAD domain-containing protein